MSAQRGASFAVIGTITQDLVTTTPLLPIAGTTVTGQEYVMSIGGRGATQAFAFARLHHPISLIGCVGHDPFGETILATLTSEGIVTEGVKSVASSKTGMSLSLVPTEGAAAALFIPGANHHLSPQYVDSFWKLKQPQFQAISIQMDLPIDAVILAATLAKQQHAWVTLFGIPTGTLPATLVQQTDMMILTWAEAAHLTGATTPDAAIHFLVQHGVARVIIAAHEHGTWYWDGSAVAHIPATLTATADPTGSTDAFITAFTSRYLEEHDLARAIRYGNTAQMLAASRIGSHVSLPLKEEIDASYARK